MLIKNGYIVDGTGSPWFKADVRIIGEKITEVAKNIVPNSGEEIIDAKRLVVTPGFIDPHTHSDWNFITDPKADSKIRQGVTTEIIGNCGNSAAPLIGEALKRAKEQQDYINIDWTTFKEYYNKLDKIGLSTNLVPLVGHGTIRLCVLGMENREPTENEMEEMKSLVRESMITGAFGLSSGLLYSPGNYATTEELIDLCRIVAEYDGFYATHKRNQSEYLYESVCEAIEIGEKADVPVLISHYKACGKASWGLVNDGLIAMERARARGVNVKCDQYPYTAWSTSLSAMLPNWVHEGGTQKMIEKLKIQKNRKRIRREIESGIFGWENCIKNCGWEGIFIVYLDKNKDLIGKTLAEISAIKNKDPFSTAFDLLIEENGKVSTIGYAMCEDDVISVIKHRLTMIGSDGSSIKDSGPLRRGIPHPRNYSTFANVLGKYVREKKILTLEEAVRKMTSLPANHIHLMNRGLIRSDMFADITIFDPATIRQMGTYTDPHRYPKGIEYVIVNGKLAVKEDESTGITAGKALRNKKIIR